MTNYDKNVIDNDKNHDIDNEDDEFNANVRRSVKKEYNLLISAAKCDHLYKSVNRIKHERIRNLSIFKKFLCCAELQCLYEYEQSPKIFNLFRDQEEYKYIEELTTDCMLQLLQESLLSNYIQVETFYYPPTKKILLWFHNVKGNNFVDYKTGILNTVYGFRDFYKEIIIPEEILKNEKIKDDESSFNTSNENINEQQNSLNKLKTNKNTSVVFHGTTSSSFISNNDNHYSSNKQDNYNNKSNYNGPSDIYDLGKTKIKYDECIQKYVSKDGVYITVKKDEFYKSKKNLTININKVDTELIIYKNLRENENEELNFYNENMKTQNEEFPLLLKLPNDILLHVDVEEYVLHFNPQFSMINEFKIKNLVITLPNGLIIEFINNKYDDNQIYIKQKYLNKGPECNKIWDDKYRCFLKSGCVLIYKNDGVIDILYNNSVVSNVQDIKKTSDFVIDMEKIIGTEEVKKEISNTNTSTKDKKSSKKYSEKHKEKEINEEILVENITEDIKMKLPYEVSKHNVTSWSGIDYIYEENRLMKTVDKNVNIRTIFEPFVRLYIDRNDGIKTFYDSNGNLSTVFKDGTKLTTYYHEVQGGETLSDTNFETEGFNEKASTDSSWQSNLTLDFFDQELKDRYNFSATVIQKSSFESYKLGSIMEHPNYVTVKFLPENDSVQLLLPGNITINVFLKDGKELVEISVDISSKAFVTFSKYSVNFVSNILSSTNKQNATYIVPMVNQNYGTDEDTYFCKTIDSYDNAFYINDSGDVKTFLLKQSKDFVIRPLSLINLKIKEYYYDNRIPSNVFERFFVVNDDYSGYEFINENDINIFDEKDKKMYNNVQVILNHTNGRIESKMRQYLINRNFSKKFLIPYMKSFIEIPPEFQRSRLSETWTTEQSPWFFYRSGTNLTYYQTSCLNISRHDDKEIIAVLIRTIQKVMNTETYNGIKIVIKSLENYTNENNELFKKYENQGFIDFEIDNRLKETHEIIYSIKNEYPKWNVIKSYCTECHGSFGYLQDDNKQSLISQSESPSSSFSTYSDDNPDDVNINKKDSDPKKQNCLESVMNVIDYSKE